MFSEEWIDRVLIMAVSGLVAFLVALGVVRIWRAFSARGPHRPRADRRRFH
jgi:hypothetical protein